MDILKKMKDMLQDEYNGIKEYVNLMQESGMFCEEFKHIISEELCHATILTKMIKEIEEKKKDM